MISQSLFDIERLPSTLQISLTDALKSWHVWSDFEAQIVRQLHGGLTNHSFLVEAGGQLQVLRLNAVNSDILSLDRGLELEIFQLASDAGITPALLYCDPMSSFLVYQYVPGRNLQRQDWAGTDTLGQLAAMLKSIHQLPAVTGYLDVREKAKNYWRQIDTELSLFSKLRLIEPEIELHIVRALSNNTQPCVCHNDLLPENIIVAEDWRLLAIDWEYAAMGDPFFDLAVIVEGLELSDQQVEVLLSVYICGSEGALSRDQVLSCNQRLLDARVIYNYLSLLWYGVQHCHRPERFSQADFDAKLNHLCGLLE